MWVENGWYVSRDIYYAKYYGRGGGKWLAGEKNEIRERKKEENHIEKGGKGLKNASFWAINSKNFAGGLPPARRKLIVGKKKLNLKRGEDDQNAQYISLEATKKGEICLPFTTSPILRKEGEKAI